MGDNRLFRIFAWTIGVLIVLWMLTECLGGVDPADPRDLQPDRNGDQYAADCDRAWEALELASNADVDTLDAVLDRLDAIDSEIVDGNLKARAAEYGRQAQTIVTSTEDEQERADLLTQFRQSESFSLASQCPVS